MVTDGVERNAASRFTDYSIATPFERLVLDLETAVKDIVTGFESGNSELHKSVFYNSVEYTVSVYFEEEVFSTAGSRCRTARQIVEQLDLEGGFILVSRQGRNWLSITETARRNVFSAAVAALQAFLSYGRERFSVGTLETVFVTFLDDTEILKSTNRVSDLLGYQITSGTSPYSSTDDTRRSFGGSTVTTFHSVHQNTASSGTVPYSQLLPRLFYVDYSQQIFFDHIAKCGFGGSFGDSLMAATANASSTSAASSSSSIREKTFVQVTEQYTVRSPYRHSAQHHIAATTSKNNNNKSHIDVLWAHIGHENNERNNKLSPPPPPRHAQEVISLMATLAYPKTKLSAVVDSESHSSLSPFRQKGSSWLLSVALPLSRGGVESTLHGDASGRSSSGRQHQDHGSSAGTTSVAQPLAPTPLSAHLWSLLAVYFCGQTGMGDITVRDMRHLNGTVDEKVKNMCIEDALTLASQLNLSEQLKSKLKGLFLDEDEGGGGGGGDEFGSSSSAYESLYDHKGIETELREYLSADNDTDCGADTATATAAAVGTGARSPPRSAPSSPMRFSAANSASTRANNQDLSSAERGFRSASLALLLPALLLKGTASDTDTEHHSNHTYGIINQLGARWWTFVGILRDSWERGVKLVPKSSSPSLHSSMRGLARDVSPLWNQLLWEDILDNNGSISPLKGAISSGRSKYSGTSFPESMSLLDQKLALLQMCMLAKSAPSTVTVTRGTPPVSVTLLRRAPKTSDELHQRRFILEKLVELAGSDEHYSESEGSFYSATASSAASEAAVYSAPRGYYDYYQKAMDVVVSDMRSWKASRANANADKADKNEGESTAEPSDSSEFDEFCAWYTAGPEGEFHELSPLQGDEIWPGPDKCYSCQNVGCANRLCVWKILWNNKITAPCAASEQKPLFSAELEAEKILAYLEGMTVKPLATELLFNFVKIVPVAVESRILSSIRNLRESLVSILETTMDESDVIGLDNSGVNLGTHYDTHMLEAIALSVEVDALKSLTKEATRKIGRSESLGVGVQKSTNTTLLSSWNSSPARSPSRGGVKTSLAAPDGNNDSNVNSDNDGDDKLLHDILEVLDSIALRCTELENFLRNFDVVSELLVALLLKGNYFVDMITMLQIQKRGQHPRQGQTQTPGERRSRLSVADMTALLVTLVALTSDLCSSGEFVPELGSTQSTGTGTGTAAYEEELESSLCQYIARGVSTSRAPHKKQTGSSTLHIQSTTAADSDKAVSSSASSDSRSSAGGGGSGVAVSTSGSGEIYDGFGLPAERIVRFYQGGHRLRLSVMRESAILSFADEEIEYY